MARERRKKPHFQRRAFIDFRQFRKWRAFCLGVCGFTSPPICQALALGLLVGDGGALRVL